MDRHLADPIAGVDLDRLAHKLGRRCPFSPLERRSTSGRGTREPTEFPILVGAILLTPWTAQVLGEQGSGMPGNTVTYVLAGLTLAGTLFTWWARIHLGRFWSNAITRKEGHRVIDTGPYGLVRHPIYTGLSAACWRLASRSAR